MKIIDIADVSAGFDKVSIHLNGWMYQVVFLAAQFEYIEEPSCRKNFDNTNLKEIFKVFAAPEDTLKGELLRIEIVQASAIIRECFSYREIRETHEINGDYSDEVLQPKLDIFFAVLSEYWITLNADVYQFTGYRGSYFASYMSWGFCLVFISKEANKGLLVFADPII